MDTDQTRRMIEALAAEEAALVDAVKKADVRLAQVRAALAALLVLEGDEPVQFEGKLADACRVVLKKHAGASLSPLQVRDELKVIGYDISKDNHSNIMASIHSVLKRLKESGEVESKEAKDGSGTRYRWPLDREVPGSIGHIGRIGTRAEPNTEQFFKFLNDPRTTQTLKNLEDAVKHLPPGFDATTGKEKK